MEQDIISPVSTELIESELSESAFLRDTNKGGNKIYVVDAYSAPNVMREIGRLREEAFRAAGGGTGKDCDIDEYDLMTPPCRQLVVWDPDARLIIGAYRYILGKDIKFCEDGSPRIATSHMFKFSQKFVDEYLPYILELGRSFVRLEYQSSKAGAKALYALDNLWDGLGALTVVHPDIKYFFGKVTMYPSYKTKCRNMILYFFKKYFGDPDKLVYPMKPLEVEMDEEFMENLFVGGSYAEDYKILNQEIRSCGINIPPLVNAYMNLSPTMRSFGTAINDEFGDVEETGIMVTIDEILENKRQRHIETFTPQNI